MLLSEQENRNEGELVKLLEACVKDYPDVRLPREAVNEETAEKPLGELAKPVLHKIQFLSVGKTAQEIRGKDVDGKEFQLSNYRGKVVLLDFFADWCPHCVAMYPHERQLVSQYAGQSFVILGVSQESKDTLRQLFVDKKVTWRCWSDGEDKHIGEEWQVTAYPTIYLIDQEGVIRRTFSGRPQEAVLDQAIKDLVEKGTRSRPQDRTVGQ